MSNKDMKLQRIETPDYILWVSDKEIKKDDIIFYHHPKQSFDMASIHKVINPNYSLDEPAYRVKFDTGWGVIEGCKKIIAYQPKDTAKELDLPLLPEMVVEDDVEKLYYKLFVGGDSKIYPRGKEHKKNWINGYKTANKNHNEKLHELLSDFYVFATEGEVCNHEVINEFIQSLKHPKTPKWFVAEMEDDLWIQDYADTPTSPLPPMINLGGKLKTTTINGKTYLVGKYE